MKKQTIFKAVEDHIHSFREKVEKNDGSGIATLAQSTLSGLKAVKNRLLGSGKARTAVEKTQEYFGRMEEAAKKGDRALTVTLLDKIEKIARAMRTEKAAPEKAEAEAAAPEAAETETREVEKAAPARTEEAERAASEAAEAETADAEKADAEKGAGKGRNEKKQ